MAKKQLEDDLLTGASLSEGKDKSQKKAEKAAQKKAKAKKKSEEKRTALKAEIDALKEELAKETDSAKKDKISAKIKKLSDAYASVGSTKGVAKRTATIIKSVVCVVLVVALLVTYVATGAVRKGFIASLSIPAQTLTGVTVTNGESKARIKVSTYNFYFATVYNNLQSQKDMYEQYGLDPADYGLDVDFGKKFSSQDYTYTDEETKKEKTISWSAHMNELVLDAIESTYTYYLAAVAANDGKDPEITDDQKQELNDTIKEYRENAEKYGYTLSGYLVRAMGRGVTESVFRTESTRQYIASNYQNELNDTTAVKKEYTKEDINKYKDENLDELKTVDVKIFECANEDEAKEFASKLAADGSNFADLCVKYSSEKFDKSSYADPAFSTEIGATKAWLQSKGYAIATADEHKHEDGEEHSEDEEVKYSGLDWLFSKDRKAGDIKQYSTTVVYVIAPASLSDRKTVDVRHILIAPETDEESTSAKDATDAQWGAAYEKAKNILAKWDKTEDGFAKLAKENSQDGNADDGGIYQDVVTSYMVNSFNTWCFDADRKVGDTAIVKTEFGYHIMYFVGTNDKTVWQKNAESALASADSKSEIEKLEKEYTIKQHWFGSRYFEKDVDIAS